MLVNAVYSADLSGDLSQLTSYLANLDNLAFDQIQVLDKEGNRIYRKLFNDLEEIPATSGTEHPVIEASLENEPYSESGLFDGRMAITSAAPITLYGEPVGHLVGVSFFDLSFARSLSALCRNEIAFFDERGVFASTSEDLKKVDLTALLSSSHYEAIIEGSKKRVTYFSIAGKNRGALMAIDVTQLDKAKENLFQALIVIALIVAVLSLVVGLLISAGIVRPLREVVNNLKEITAGGGDLTDDLKVRSSDEIGELSECFNDFLARQREMVGRIRKVTTDLGKANEQIRSASHEVMEGAVQQSQALEVSSRGIEGIDEAAGGIAESTGNLVASAEESS
jgi:methyl-accepting chemotaxis protein